MLPDPLASYLARFVAHVRCFPLGANQVHPLNKGPNRENSDCTEGDNGRDPTYCRSIGEEGSEKSCTEHDAENVRQCPFTSPPEDVALNGIGGHGLGARFWYSTKSVRITRGKIATSAIVRPTPPPMSPRTKRGWSPETLPSTPATMPTIASVTVAVNPVRLAFCIMPSA